MYCCLIENVLTLFVEKLNNIIENYPSELKLLLICCGSERWKAKDLIVNFNWETFLQLVKRHRVIPYIYQFGLHNSGFFPVEIQKLINETQKANTQRMLWLAVEMLRLQNLFTVNEIKNVPIKGPALAYQLYNNSGMRNSMDLDFLVYAKDLDAVSTLMINEGYKQIKPDFALSPRQKKAHITLIHHYYFKHQKTGLLVEIHWKLVTPPSLFLHSENLFFESLQPTQQFPVIKPELLLHYLIVHGSMHRWYKLFWLKDIDELFRRNLIFDFDYFNKLTVLFRDERMINQTLVLSELLFNTPMPSTLKPKVYSQKLIYIAIKAIQTSEEKLHERTLERVRRFFYIVRLKSGLNHFVSCIKAPGTNYLDWKTLPLPDSLFFMYYPLRPFLWFWSVFIKKIKSA